MSPLTFVNEHNIAVAAIRNLAGLATPMTLRVAVTLGLPDRLRGNGTSAEQVATELDLSPVALELLLGRLTTLGIVEYGSTGYRTTDYGATLCNDADNGLTNFLHLDMAGGRAELAFVELLHSITTGRAAYSLCHGQDFWADLEPTATGASRTFSAHHVEDRAQVDHAKLLRPSSRRGGCLSVMRHPARLGRRTRAPDSQPLR